MKYFYLLFLVVLFSCSQKPQKNYIQYIDLLIGTGPANTQAAKEHPGDHVPNGQTISAVTAPFGMTQWTPQIYDTERKMFGSILSGSHNDSRL